jgi:photosystem II stability/assembly factor-like uncharacterized protein
MKKSSLLLSVLLIMSASVITFGQLGWVEQTNPLGYGDTSMIGKVHFVSPVEGWISCGNGGLLHTTNSGVTWDFVNPFPNDTVGRMSDPAVSMSWVGNTHGWVIGGINGEDIPHGSIIFYTTNGGVNWQKKVVSNTDGEVGFQIQFVDVNNGWLLNYNFLTQAATFLKTTDGGNNWVPFNGAGIFYFLDANNGYAYNGSGPLGSEPPFRILRTTNGGTDWTEQLSDNTPGEFSAIRFADLNHGWVVGRNGKVLKTTNGGTNWNWVTNSGIDPQSSCKTVFALDQNHVWIPSKANDPLQTPYVQYTSNGGASWSTQMTPFGSVQGGNAIFSICFVDAQTGWLTADYGRIARFTGSTDIDGDINSVNEFKLEQNYPNPFNPNTVISYQLPVNSNVTLKVYDVLGNEVATLVNEEKPAGRYEVDFTASSLTSGVYFYKLAAGNYLVTKKMILMK